ncbi:hypothetical protein Nepgr_010741 [Nepenthes gracilis]|uniref:CCT domain-containing protein n=1 Tax=Nepenthes gracilis TaxID=150966 RepID=A0AAD3SDR8_NEPGR|nr:hypothetical protein Nepgr_010741 [Nepenthes gracilis]
MFAEAALLYPYFQSCSQEVQQLEELCHLPKPNSSLITIAEYDLGGEGDLFKAAEPIIEEPVMSLDPMAAAISMLSCGDGIMPAEGLKVGDMESLQNEQLFGEVFCECNKDIFKKTSAEAAVSEVLDIKLPEVLLNEIQDEKNRLLPEFLFTESVGSGCLGSMELLNATSMRPSFLSFPELDFSSAYRMRRAFSDGDIKTLGNGNISLIHSPLRPPLVTGGCMSEDRMHKLSRYRDKKSRRNFGRKIKYACRKALADSQPRIRGRFAKTDESDICRKQ